MAEGRCISGDGEIIVFDPRVDADHSGLVALLQVGEVVCADQRVGGIRSGAFVVLQHAVLYQPVEHLFEFRLAQRRYGRGE